MTNNNMRDTIAQMLNDFEATPENIRAAAQHVAALRARLAELRIVVSGKLVELAHRVNAQKHLNAFSIAGRRNERAIKSLRDELPTLRAELDALIIEAEAL